LRQNREKLLGRGILALTENQLQRKLPYFFKKDARLTPWARRMHLDQPEQMRALRKETDSYIQDQIRKHKPDSLVLSSEGLAVMVASNREDMRDYFSAFASELEIVFFLRRPDFRILSGYKNKIRNKGFTEEISAEYTKKYDDGKTLRQIGDCFGTRAIRPIVCMDSHVNKAEADGHIEALLKVLFKGNDITTDDFNIPERRNIAWDYRAVHYMREFNKIARDRPDFEYYRQPLARLLQDHFSGGEKLKISKSLAESIVANYQEGTEAIRQQYFPEQPTLFHTDFSMYSEDTSSQAFGAEDAVLVSLLMFEDLLKDKKYQPR